MKHILFLFSIVSVFIMVNSCTNSFNENKFEYAGGTFSLALTNEPATLIARNVTDVYSATLFNQIYQGLTTLDPKTLEVKPCLAKSWEVSPDQKSFTFELRKGVFFHKNKNFKEAIKMTPQDVLFSIELACSPYQGETTAAYNSLYHDVIKGASEFYKGEANHISGVRIMGNKITIELIDKDVNFIAKLAQPTAAILSKKVVKKGLETELIGTGPFKFDKYIEVDGQTNIILKRNKNYYETDDQGNQLPYLDSLIFKIESRKLRQLKMFENNEIQLIDGLPPSRISSMLGSGKIEDFNSTPPTLVLRRKPLLGTQYYLFNLLKKEFKDVRVRKAFNYAIDREVIISEILNHQAYSKGDGGIVPPSAFNGYDSESVKKHSYTFQPKKARKLLAAAGYPNGEGFPSINLKFNLGTIHSAVADEISKQLKQVLNINMNLDGIPFQNKLEDQKNAAGDIFRTAWYADYFSPENFLINAYGKYVPEDSTKPSGINQARYRNKKFDELFEKGKSTTDIVDRYKYFSEAESIMMDDAPFIILWYEETIKIAYSKVRNLPLNKMNYYSFKNVYIKNWTKKEWNDQKK